MNSETRQRLRLDEALAMRNTWHILTDHMLSKHVSLSFCFVPWWTRVACVFSLLLIRALLPCPPLHTFCCTLTPSTLLDFTHEKNVYKKKNIELAQLSSLYYIYIFFIEYTLWLIRFDFFLVILYNSKHQFIDSLFIYDMLIN